MSESVDKCEQWRTAPGYPDYRVSNMGRVLSVKRTIHFIKQGKPATMTRGGKMMSPNFTNKKRGDKHLKVLLTVNRKSRGVYVHRLVMAAFVGPCPDEMEICHNNGDPTDNRLENLRYDTRSENMIDIVRSGEHHHAKKTHCPQGHAYIDANLVPSGLKHGYRACLSCNRARRKISRNPGLKDQFMEIANENYRLCTGIKAVA